MGQCHAGTAAQLGALHADTMRADGCDQLSGHARVSGAFDLAVVKAHAKMLAALTTLKAEGAKVERHYLN